MVLIRAVFWFAVVALLMPQGPDLGLDFHRFRAGLAEHAVSLPAGPAVTALVEDVEVARRRASDPVRRWRAGILARLSTVRGELLHDRASRNPGWPVELGNSLRAR